MIFQKQLITTLPILVVILGLVVPVCDVIKMKIIIAGSRTLEPTFEDIERGLDLLCGKGRVTEIVCGMARGVDLRGLAYGRDNDIFVSKWPADWSKGKNAGFVRNEEMGLHADALLAIWDGKSNGTKYMINFMNRMRKPYVVLCRP